MKRFNARQTYLLFILIMSVFLITGCGGGGGSEGTEEDGIAGNWVGDTTAPRVTRTDPITVLAPGVPTSGVPVDRVVTATFSEEMDESTITATTFTLVGATAVSGDVTYSGITAVFTPDIDLAPLTAYTATITTGAEDLAGNALAANYVWRFTTGLTPDTTAPTMIFTGAFDGETGLPINRNSTATFSEPMDPATLNSPATNFTLIETVSGNPVTGVVTYIGNIASFNPNDDLKPNTQYTSRITTGATDLAGNALVSGLRANPWSWTTGAAPDITAPTVTLTVPADAATGVAIDSAVNATFSEAMEPLTIDFTVQTSGPPLGTILTGQFSYDLLTNIATFIPQANLTPNTDYTATIATGAEDLAGNALVSGLVPNPWTFRTAAIIPVPLAIDLGAAASFGIASRAGLTTTGVTVVNGDVALNPLATCTDATGNAGAGQTCLVQTYSSPTGMTVNGSIYWAGDPFDAGATAIAVTNDLNTAWVAGMAKVDTQAGVLVGQLGAPGPVGKIIFPGVYHEAALGLAAGLVATLDAQNDANAIFIFKVDSSFVDSGTLLLPSEIRLMNGAQARNVWFVTGAALTIGSGTTWNGNILVGGTATILNGSTVHGRVLAGAAGAGAITLTGAASPSVTTVTVPQ